MSSPDRTPPLPTDLVALRKTVNYWKRKEARCRNSWKKLQIQSVGQEQGRESREWKIRELNEEWAKIRKERSRVDETYSQAKSKAERIQMGRSSSPVVKPQAHLAERQSSEPLGGDTADSGTQPEPLPSSQPSDGDAPAAEPPAKRQKTSAKVALDKPGRLSRLRDAPRALTFTETHEGGQRLLSFELSQESGAATTKSTQAYLEQMPLLKTIFDGMSCKAEETKKLVGFHVSVKDMLACWKLGERKPFEVIRGHERGKSTEEALEELEQDMDTLHAWDTGDGSKCRPTYTVRQAFQDPRRLKCLAVKDLPLQTRTMAGQLGYHKLMDQLQLSFKRAEAEFSQVSNPKLDAQLERNQFGLLPDEKLRSRYLKSKRLTMDELRERYRIASTWAIFNAKHSMTDWHIDAAGSSTHFVVKSGVKAWVTDIGGVVSGVILKPGDAAVMQPNVRHCVFTPEESICVGGHGWHVREIAEAYQGLLKEGQTTSNETIPLWYPTFTYFALELTRDTDANIMAHWDISDTQLEKFREILQRCLGQEYTRHSSTPPQHAGFARNVLADYSWPHIFQVLKACEKSAAVASFGLLEAFLKR